MTDDGTRSAGYPEWAATEGSDVDRMRDAMSAASGFVQEIVAVGTVVDAENRRLREEIAVLRQWQAEACEWMEWLGRPHRASDDPVAFQGQRAELLRRAGCDAFPSQPHYRTPIDFDDSDDSDETEPIRVVNVQHVEEPGVEW